MCGSDSDYEEIQIRTDKSENLSSVPTSIDPSLNFFVVIDEAHAVFSEESKLPNHFRDDFKNETNINNLILLSEEEQKEKCIS